MVSLEKSWGSRVWKRFAQIGLGALALFISVATLAPGVLAAEQSAGADRVFINAKSAIVIDADTHHVLYQKNADTPSYPASTTKLMTAILLVSHLNPDDKIYISSTAAHQHRVRLGLESGTTITADQALHAILMKSANDVAYAIAETVGGSQDGFARMMNLKARLIGCTHTNFVTPNGLHEDAHMTTAHDVALITAEAIKYPRIVAAMHTTDYRIDGKRFGNGNRMMQLAHPSFGQVIGGKTGYTSKAMFCLALAAKQNGHTRVSVVLGAPHKQYMYRETRRLLEFAYHEKNVTLV